MRETFDPKIIRVWRDSSTKAQPCCFSQRFNSLAFTLHSNHLWLLCQEANKLNRTCKEAVSPLR